jgi:hypothetical protein
VSSRDVFRLGMGAILLLLGGLLVRQGLGGTPSQLEQLVTSGLVVGLGGAVAVIIAGARAAVGSLIVTDRPARGVSPREGRHLRP